MRTDGRRARGQDRLTKAALANMFVKPLVPHKGALALHATDLTALDQLVHGASNRQARGAKFLGKLVFGRYHRTRRIVTAFDSLRNTTANLLVDRQALYCFSHSTPTFVGNAVRLAVIGKPILGRQNHGLAVLDKTIVLVALVRSLVEHRRALLGIQQLGLFGVQAADGNMLLAVRHMNVAFFEQNVVEALLLKIVIGKRRAQRQVDVSRLDRRRRTINHAHASNAKEWHAQINPCHF